MAKKNSKIDPLDPLATADFGDSPGGEPGGNEAQAKYLSDMVSQKIRDEWIRQEMLKRRDEYTDVHDLRVFIGTWNVNGKKPQESIDDWLRPGGDRVPDVYVCGFQELVDLTAGNVISDSASKERSQVWMERISLTLSKLYGGNRYHLIAERHLVGIMMCIFVLDKHITSTPRVSIQSVNTPTGVMGMGNKGGVSVRFQIYNSTFCFVCAHLAAHRDAVEARNSDYKSIMTKTAFRDDSQAMTKRNAEDRLSAPADATTFLPNGAAVYRKGPPDHMDHHLQHSRLVSPMHSEDEFKYGSLSLDPVLSDPVFGITDHDYVFWLGDFNYRINCEHSIESVFQRIMANDLEWLRQNDQLLTEQDAGRTFEGFKEAEIQFLPTYKYQPGTNQYDRRPEKKVRAPAYCDRILWREANGGGVRILRYMSCSSLNSSDHKPVVALFETQVSEKVASKKQAVFSEIIRQLDRRENEERPKIEVDKRHLSFPGGLTFMVSRQETVVLKNVGMVPATWRLVPKLEDLTICKPWVHIYPDYGLITPGDTLELTITVTVTATTARKISSGTDTLDDILIIRLENGQDHFISISTELNPTCFGVSLAKLVRTHYPFGASAQEQERLQMERIQKMGGVVQASVPLRLPKELWWMCNFLWIFNLLKVPQLFVVSQKIATPERLHYVRQCIDFGVELVPDNSHPASGHATAHAVAAVILEFFNALPEPVVPYKLFPAGDLDSISMDAWGRRFLDQLPPLSHNVFVYTVTFLREILANSKHVRIRDIASVFARVLMRPNCASEKHKESSPQTNIPFDLPNWITGEKKDSTLGQTAEKIMLHFLRVDRSALF
mmetsp:Transcript_6080/g.9507  ORF Transcript_6080/g.9507 Transcript_6080/m.9507 type:complete len:834 (+) Transcript_6080:210-2711(+)|eukprot:CAMPEP_0203788912 /NCGR_PEP_ID=MMETSP0100_2-20121128/3123_1 /ASSEMBLY_ACC=CAM_ASM_000210 /TAXON_ID=96639 /ORGANISM=" , Strain NY0313808BC1" /LENGTH=833 /DNA_ID=CAMNT_0050691733 /DNA_START=153 /DNA_END=2654 /DNA_ORIENTATION=-